MFNNPNPYIHFLRKIFIFFSALFIIENVHAQSKIDTIEIAKELRTKHKLAKAFNLFGKYHDSHPEELNALWLQAQTAYWMQRVNTSVALYQKALDANPTNYYLLLDYAKVLSECKMYDKSEVLLLKYLAYDNTNADALLILAKIEYWRGDYSKALELIENCKKNKNVSIAILNLEQEIRAAIATTIKLEGSYENDDQPLQTCTNKLEVGKYLSRYANLHAEIKVPVFINNPSASNVIQIEGGDKLKFTNAGMEADISAGLVQFANHAKTALMGNISITKTLATHAIIKVSLNRKPYLFSVASTSAQLMEDNVSTVLGWNNQKSVNGNVSFSNSSYPDGNNIKHFQFNIYSPIIRKGLYSFQAGYGYKYDDSKGNTFSVYPSLLEIIASGSGKIPGIYNPYFTPKKQQVHSLTMIFAYQPVQKISIGASFNYGFYGNTQNPYFDFVYQGNLIIGAVKEFTKEKFSPLLAGAYLLYSLSPRSSCSFSYQYNQTFFYKSQCASFSFKTNLIHANK